MAVIPLNPFVRWLLTRCLVAVTLPVMSATPEKNVVSAENLFAQPGQTWRHNAFTHATDVRLLDSGIYIQRESFDVHDGHAYSQGVWWQNGERIVLKASGVKDPALEFAFRVIQGCRVLVPTDHLSEPDYNAAYAAYVSVEDPCPHLLDGKAPRRHCRLPDVLSHVMPGRDDASAPGALKRESAPRVDSKDMCD